MEKIYNSIINRMGNLFRTLPDTIQATTLQRASIGSHSCVSLFVTNFQAVEKKALSKKFVSFEPLKIANDLKKVN